MKKTLYMSGFTYSYDPEKEDNKKYFFVTFKAEGVDYIYSSATINNILDRCDIQILIKQYNYLNELFHNGITKFEYPHNLKNDYNIAIDEIYGKIEYDHPIADEFLSLINKYIDQILTIKF